MRIERRAPDNPDTREDTSVERRVSMSDERKKLTFDPTINAGHLLTFAGFLITMALGWSALDKRVVVLEEQRKAQAQLDLYQDSTQRASIDAVRESLREIKEGLAKLNDRLEQRRP